MKSFLLIIASLVAFSLTAYGEKVPEVVKKHCNVLLEAIEKKDIKLFHSVSDEPMQKAITPQLLNNIFNQVNPVLEEGYTLSFFGSIDRLQYKTYYWKLTAKKPKVTELLVQLTIKNQKDMKNLKVSGFFLQ